MKITRDIDLRFRIGDHSIRVQNDIELEITGQEAFRAVFEWDGPHSITAVVNCFAQIVKAMPDEKIAALSPEARRLIAGSLDNTAKRFLQGESVPA